ncbi:MAG: serine/threonine-protein kinase [Candidatus Humimicrobiaceae bacterium]
MNKKINNYQIFSKIASGGMSEVYLADDIKTGKKVALKILDAKLSIDPEYLHRFKKEASICQQLDHKNIVKILSYGTFEESYYIAYEYIEGITLDKLIRQKDLTITEVENISIQLLAGLSFAHSKNIIHRDIKPSNIIIENKTVKILDFGIAKQELAATVTKAGLFMGSPHYVSPEQIEGHDIDYRSDIYSFGIVLYEMIEGRVPFSADTPWGIIRAHLDKEVPEITKEALSYLKEVVYKCLSKRKEDRFKSANEIISVIANKEEIGKRTVIINKEKEATIFRVDSQSSTNEKSKEEVKRKRKGKIVAAILVPILVVMVYFTTGLSFFGGAYKFYNEKDYFSASYNFKISKIFLIPNSQYNALKTLDLKTSEIIKLVEKKEYEKVSSNLSTMKKYFPEYLKISEIENTLENDYNERLADYGGFRDGLIKLEDKYTSKIDDLRNKFNSEKNNMILKKSYSDKASEIMNEWINDFTKLKVPSFLNEYFNLQLDYLSVYKLTWDSFMDSSLDWDKLQNDSQSADIKANKAFERVMQDFNDEANLLGQTIPYPGFNNN